ncbi:LOB domain-containing protein 36 [Phtheirospermum japonicum]|uniref:LOB domain-containing protein 36 n=1 Tax=Phtheirospermum japonicum TaxID=374723 RepID=A0A830C9P6_9LAMI|nr:LOB domain-containing protein 36 [Phtheirospermum japonicum]
MRRLQISPAKMHTGVRVRPLFPAGQPPEIHQRTQSLRRQQRRQILNELNPTPRNDAVKSLAYEAECHIKDTIYGCVGFVSLLQHHLRQVQQEIKRAKKELATYIRPAAAEF